MSEWRDSYLEQLKHFNAAKTVETYGTGTKKFEAFLESWGKTLETAPRQSLSSFAVYLVKLGLAPSSVHIYSISAMQFCRWCTQNGLAIPEMDKPQLPSIKEPVPVILREKALAVYVQICQNIRDPYKTALLLLPLTGLRVSELCHLRLEDVILEPPWVRFIINDTKNKQGRQVPMLPAGKPMLGRYLKYVRPELPGDSWLFPIRNGGHISKREVQKKMREVRAKLGMNNLTPHKLRHTYLTILNESGITGFDLAQIAGHKNMNTSRLYVHQSNNSLSELVAQVDTPWMKGT